MISRSAGRSSLVCAHSRYAEADELLDSPFSVLDGTLTSTETFRYGARLGVKQDLLGEGLSSWR